ncbi:MAG: anaerobic C4-dicarboxylate transporter family protein [Enterobacteriaceae bacterium]
MAVIAAICHAVAGGLDYLFTKLKTARKNPEIHHLAPIMTYFLILFAGTDISQRCGYRWIAEARYQALPSLSTAVVLLGAITASPISAAVVMSSVSGRSGISRCLLFRCSYLRPFW